MTHPRTRVNRLAGSARSRPEHLEITTDNPATELHNGDGLCYYDLQKELVGLQINRAEAQKTPGLWRLFPKDPMAGFKDLRKGVQVNRNRDMSWVRTLDKKSAERRMGVWMQLQETNIGTASGLQLTLTDEAGHTGQAELVLDWQAPKDAGAIGGKTEGGLGQIGRYLV